MSSYYSKTVDLEGTPVDKKLPVTFLKQYFVVCFSSIACSSQMV